MTFQANPSAIPFFAAAVVSGLLAIFAWRRRGLSMAPAFAVMMTGEAAWALLAALELIYRETPVKRFFFELRVAGAVIAILGLVAVVLRYTGHTKWLGKRWFTAICLPAALPVLFTLTNEWHHLYWYDHKPVDIAGLAFLQPIYGPVFWIQFTYCYGLIVASTMLLAQAVVTSGGLYRVQATVMLFGVILPWVVNMMDMSHAFGVWYTDTTAGTFAITGLAFLPALFRYRLLELTPVAWAAVVRGMNDPVVVIDASGRIVELNEVAQKLSGRPLREILGFEAVKAFSRWPKLAERLAQLHEGRDGSFELAGADPEPFSAFDARISPLGGKDSLLGWVVVLRDITEHKRAAEERLRMLSVQSARAEAEAANRAKDRFLANVSHELRTPLTPVLAAVTAMLSEDSTPEPLHSVLEMIRRNISLEARLIDDLLDLARIRRGALLLKREVIDAHEMINRVAAICDDDFRRASLELSLDLPAKSHHIDADPIRFQQVLWNLIKNAIKFTPSGGQVIVRSRDLEPGSAQSDGTWLIVEISDTGIGIEPDALLRIFDVAEQGGNAATRRFGGLGLGLTLSRSIVEQHGGILSASSAGAGFGATFCIEIPSVAEPELPTPIPVVAPEVSAAPSRCKIRILLVDDNADTLRFLSTILVRRGHQVVTACDMASALRIAAETDLDLLISDIELPDGNGLELMDAIRASSRPIPGIALSGFGSADDIEQSLAAGFAVHLTKPVDFRRLEETIQRIATGDPAESVISS